MDDWFAGREGGIVPLRQQEGFVIVGAWVDRPHDRSGWVIGYPGVDRFAAAEDRYRATSARLALQPVPSVFIEQATLGVVDAVI